MRRYLQMIILSVFFLSCAGGHVTPNPPITCTPPYGWTEQIYLELNPDVATANTTALKHWCEFGFTEGRPWYKGSSPPTPPILPSDFDGAAYIAYWTDVAAAGYTAETAKNHYLEVGWKEGRWPLPVTPPPPPVPPTPPVPPPPIGEIKDFNNLPESANSDAIYFGVGKCAGIIHFGEYGYQGGDHSSSLFQYPHTFVQSFDAESVFAIKDFKGKCYLTVEHGKYKSVDKAMVYQLQGSSWVEVYRHPIWDLMFNLHVHGDYLYATGAKINGQGGTVRTSDGVTWSQYIATSNYWQWDMTTLGSDIWFSGAYGGDYGGECRPAVYRNQTRVWDGSDVGAGFLGIAAFRGDIFLGQANPAQIVRFSDKKIVLTLPTHEKFNKLAVDEASGTLYAFSAMVDVAINGARVYSTKDGNTWKNVGGMFAVPHLFFSYYDPVTFDLWITGGKWSQSSGGYGRIYKSVR